VLASAIRSSETRRNLLSLLGLGAIVTCVVAAASAASPSLELSAVSMLVNLMVVVGIYVFIGNAGVFSFGHVAFMAVGAYTASLLLIPAEMKTAAFPFLADPLLSAELPGIPAMLAAGAVALVAAAILAIPLMRLSGLAAALGTFVMLIIAGIVFENLEVVTGGTAGLSGIPPAGVWTILVWALVCVAIAWAFQQTSACVRLRASREDHFAAQAVGISISRERGVAFVVSAFIVGIAGACFAQAQQAINPGAFYLDLTFVTLAMLVVGGMQSLTGAVIGTIALSVLSELLSRLVTGIEIGDVMLKLPSGSQQVGFAVVMLLALILRPTGLTRGREL
jgi:branched-chain amino acid transport system permease protein